MTENPGPSLSRPLRFKLLILIAGPLLVALLLSFDLLDRRLGADVDLGQRADRIQAHATRLLEEASRICAAALEEPNAGPRRQEKSRLGARLEGAGVLDRSLHYVRWEGSPPGPPPGLGRPGAPEWRIHGEGVRTRLLVAAGPDDRGRFALATFVIDSNVEDLEFADLLPADLLHGVQLDLQWVDSRIGDPLAPDEPRTDDGTLVAPLRFPDGRLSAVLNLEAIPAEHRASQLRAAGRAWALLLSLLLAAMLFDWSRIVTSWRGLLAAGGVLVLSRVLLSLARAPSVLLPRELGSASVYGSSEAWRLLASPADLLLTAAGLYLAAVALRSCLCATVEERRRVSLAVAFVAASAVSAAVLWLTLSLAHNSRVSVFGGPSVWRGDAAMLLALGLVLAALGAAELWATAWALVRPPDLRGRRRPRRVPVALALLILSLVCSVALQRVNDRLIFERLSSELAPQILEQSERRAVALRSGVRHVLDVYRDDTMKAERWSALPKFMGYHFWVTGELFHSGYKSSLDFYNPSGERISHFGFDVPELDEEIGVADAPGGEPQIRTEAYPLTSFVQQTALHLEAPVMRNGDLLGFVVGHVLDEPDNLPFLPWSQPYLEALGPGSRWQAGDELRGDLHYVRYDAHGTVLVTTLVQPPAESAALRRAAERQEPVSLRTGDEAYSGLAIAEQDGLHLLLVPGRGFLERLASAVRLVLLGFATLALLALLPYVVRPSGFMTLARGLRGSFHRKLQAALLAASIFPLIGLALFLQGYIERRGDSAIDGSAIAFVSAAQRQLEDYVAIQLESDTGELELNDQILYWLRRVVGQEILVYEDDRLTASSKRELFASGLLEPRLDGVVRRRLVEEGLPYVVRRTAIGPRDVPVAYAPVRSVERGELVVAVPIMQAQRQITRAVGRVVEMILLATVILVALLAVAAAYVARTVARPVRELVEATAAIADGDYATRLEARTGDEVAELVGGFNTMASALSRQRADLERRRDYMETLLRHATTGVVSVDAAGRIVTLNPAARQLLAAAGDDLGGGVDLVEVLGRSDELRPLAEALAAPRPRAGEPVEIDLERDREPHRLRVVRVDLPGTSGESVGTLILLDDVTELMRSNQLAAWAEMARAIAHEIKNPLTPIQLSSEHLRRLLDDRGVLPSAEVEACLDTIIKQVRTLYQIAGEFSAYAKLPALAPQPADPVEFLRATLEPYRAAPLPGVTIEERYGPASRVSIDQRVLARAVINLVENALQAMPDGGRLTLAVADDAERGEVVLSVEDTGVGLDAQTRSRLFEPYFSTKSSGTGLGLAIARRAVEAHHGRIDVDSELGRGTAFRIRLPMAASSPPA